MPHGTKPGRYCLTECGFLERSNAPSRTAARNKRNVKLPRATIPPVAISMRRHLSLRDLRRQVVAILCTLCHCETPQGSWQSQASVIARATLPPVAISCKALHQIAASGCTLCAMTVSVCHCEATSVAVAISCAARKADEASAEGGLKASLWTQGGDPARALSYERNKKRQASTMLVVFWWGKVDLNHRKHC